MNIDQAINILELAKLNDLSKEALVVLVEELERLQTLLMEQGGYGLYGDKE